MKIGYARVSTKDQLLSMQVEALNAAGCEQIHKEIASGAKTARPVLDEIIRNLREGDTLVIWKLDRLGRNLAHLIHLTTKLIEKKVGLISLNDPIDTTTAQGRLIFGIFASLAEFERELIRERTQAGLKSAALAGGKEADPKECHRLLWRRLLLLKHFIKMELFLLRKLLNSWIFLKQLYIYTYGLEMFV